MKRQEMLDRLVNGESPIDIAIEKYKGALKGERIYSNTCPLCEIHINCYECPIMLFTGKHGCQNSPFWEWFENRDMKSTQKYLDFLIEVKRKLKL